MSAYDGGLKTFQYWGDNPIPGIHCPTCYSPIDHDAVSTQIDVRGRLDAYFPHGHLIVSERFRDFLLRSGHNDVEFPRVDAKRHLYEVRPTRVLQVDIEKSEPLLADFCTKCGNFECYVRGRGVFLHDIKRPLECGIYRTDLIVGCRMAKHFDIVAAPETKRRIMDAGFRRVQFRALPALDSEFERRKRINLEGAARMRRKDLALDRLQRMRVRRGLIPSTHASQRVFKA